MVYSCLVRHVEYEDDGFHSGSIFNVAAILKRLYHIKWMLLRKTVESSHHRKFNVYIQHDQILISTEKERAWGSG